MKHCNFFSISIENTSKQHNMDIQESHQHIRNIVMIIFSIFILIIFFCWALCICRQRNNGSNGQRPDVEHRVGLDDVYRSRNREVIEMLPVIRENDQQDKPLSQSINSFIENFLIFCFSSLYSLCTYKLMKNRGQFSNDNRYLILRTFKRSRYLYFK